MQISSRFTLAVHIFACIDVFGKDHKVTSSLIAESTNVNPVIIRKILLQLKAAGLVNVARGSGGTTVAKPLSEITFLDIYRAVECMKTENCSTFMRIQMPTALSGEIFTGYWMISWNVYRPQWKENLHPSLWRMSDGIRRTISPQEPLQTR